MSFLRLSNIHIIFIFGVLLYDLGILIFNADRGFDITDESYYILGAMYPYDVFSVITHENYYTGLLFYLSSYNLAIFRIFGILVLLLSSVWFASELYRYIDEKFELNYINYNKLYFILIISLSSLSYYLWWLVTPSYNWLSLVAMMLAMASIFRIINNNDKLEKLFNVEYIYLGFSLCLLFMAKPTSLLALFPALVLFVLFNYKKISITKVFISTSVVFFTLIIFHLILLDGGFISYIYKFKESMERLSLLEGGHGLQNSIISLYDKGLSLYSKINIHKLIVFVLFSLFITRYFYTNKLFLNILTFIFIIWFAYLLYFPTIVPFGINEKFYITILIFSIYIVLLYFFTEQRIKLNIKIYLEALFLLLFLSYLSIAISFGTNNIIWFHSSLSYILPVSGLMSFIFIIDKYHSIFKNIKVIVGIIISLSIFVLLDNAYKNPYRLNTSIEKQIEKVDLLGGLKVDYEQKIYINDLIRIKSLIKKNDEEIYLIDFTGGTPGANVILKGKFFQQQWLLGGYPGSNNFGYRILNNVPQEKLENAWILIAPNGILSLNSNLFSKLNLNITDNYDKMGTVFFKTRNEIQELWKPKVKINDK
ncbi:hypothetical protein [Aliarcobacter butzleri]|uniref:hypothetical protein n=1 Tax=Aliarcobacter butzleri TaxID=28197 RepID=UPI00126000C1|nr:hypothetical protein [Aliarcobacter butzleri]